MSRHKRKDIIMMSIILIVSLIYLIFIVGRFAQYNGIDSDYANLVLEANDIINGNFFLRGWNLTGVTFFPTDLVFFIIGACVAGVSVKSYVIAIALMYWMLLLAGFILIYSKTKQSYIGVLWYVGMTIMPNFYHMSVVRAHTGGIVWGLFALAILEKKTNKKVLTIIKYIVVMMLLAMAAMGDAVSIIIIIMPMLLIYIMEIGQDFFHYQKINVTIVWNVITIGISLLLSIVLDYLYFAIGQANKNSFLEQNTYTDFEQLGQYFSVYLKSLFTMFHADFSQQAIMSPMTIVYMVGILEIFLGVGFAVYEIVQLLRNRSHDRISAILGLGFLMISVAYIFLGMMPEENTARYFATAPVLLAVIIVRVGGSLYESHRGNVRQTYTVQMISVVVTIVVIILEMGNVPDYQIHYDSVEQGLVETLKEHNLKSGYGEFWTSSVTTVYSEEDICVRAISIEEDGATAFDWFNKEDWYQNEANFVILNANGTGIYFSIADAINIFGIPKEIITYDKYVIYVYDYDISTQLNMDISSTTNRSWDKLMEVMDAQGTY